MSGFKPYPEYKDSGVEWLGEVPAWWDVVPLKRLTALITTKAGGAELRLGLENIEGWTGRLLNGATEFSGDGVAFSPNDILFGKLRPYLAKAWLATTKGDAVGDFFVLRPEGNYASFLHKYILCREVISTLSASTVGAKMPRVSWDDMSCLPIAFPPQEEGSHIARFLDYETARIDALITEQERLIDLLNEKRQAVISHVVTKGLDPDAPMKDSGVKWLGEVPAHWDVCKLHFRYSVELGKMLDEKRNRGAHPVPYLRNQDVQWGVINLDGLPVIDIEPGEYDRYLVQRGDLLVCEGGDIGRAAIFRETCSAIAYQKALHRLRALSPQRDTAEFFFYSLVAAKALGAFEESVTKATISHLPAEKFRQHKFAFPPFGEQRQIAATLAETLTSFSDAILVAEDAVGLLTERRAALISAAVTGAIDVRDWQPPANVDTRNTADTITTTEPA